MPTLEWGSGNLVKQLGFRTATDSQDQSVHMRKEGPGWFDGQSPIASNSKISTVDHVSLS